MLYLLVIRAGSEEGIYLLSCFVVEASSLSIPSALSILASYCSIPLPTSLVESAS